ncbi:hypothetical protein ACLB2K_072448 [Fragaria x ananassa]
MSRSNLDPLSSGPSCAGSQPGPFSAYSKTSKSLRLPKIKLSHVTPSPYDVAPPWNIDDHHRDHPLSLSLGVEAKADSFLSDEYSPGDDMVLSQRLHEAFKGTVEKITGPRTVSAFKEKGVLSVSEFVTAGDNLVSKCPTWSWESGEPSKRKPYLPSEKQYLITRNVPCLRRAASVEEEYEAAGMEVLIDNEDNDGWLATHGKPKETKDRSSEEENFPSIDSLEISKDNSVNSAPSQGGAEDEDDIPDMADFEEDNIEIDPGTYLVAHEPDDDNILRTRTYDVSITYDKYYQTPRVWLTGYDESRMLLQAELVLEDVSQDHARKTVTIEDHPHLPGKHASVHPCRHGAVMKKIIDVLMSRGVEPEVDKYLFLFLKFVASVIPTIEYDYTMDFDLGSSSS